jgi:opacity protein-like surface antigen
MKRTSPFALFGWTGAGLLALTLFLGTDFSARADENLFGFVRGAETLPKGHFDLYETLTLRTGKDVGVYRGWDSDTEVEYGFTDKLQGSIALTNRYIYNHGVEELDDTNHLTFGGFEGSLKYRLLSPFKDPIGLAVRLETGWLLHDEVGGLLEHEIYVTPEVILQKNFLDDTLITELNFGGEWAWGKDPAEQYYKEWSMQGGAGISYRFARNWFIGVEGHARSEWPLFNFNNFEHVVVYAGPALHYGSERWWATLSYNYQVYGHGVDETTRSQTFAEETRHEIRLKVGFNF